MYDQQRRFMRRRFYFRLLTSLVVVSVFGLLIIYSFIAGKFFESLLILIMWIQMELSWRQIEIYKRSLEPRFTATLHSTERLPSIQYLEVSNMGKSVAYRVGVCRILTREGYEPLDPVVWREYVKSYYVDIPPGDSKKIAEIRNASVLDKYVVEVCYDTAEEPFKLFHILKFNESLLILQAPEDLPGPLLNSIIFLRNTLRGLWLKYELRKYEKHL